MAKKLTDTVNEHEAQLAQAVRTSAQQIWQAGLGAFVKAQEQQHGGADGADATFERLVAEGSVLQRRVRATGDLAEEEGAGADEGSADGADEVVAARSWDKLEQVFEDRVVRALGAIGVPSKRDLELLAGQIARLTAQVAQLQAQLDRQQGAG